MVVYLDQNKWIELARIVNGLEKTVRARRLLGEVEAALSIGVLFPISALNILEMSRIKDPGRRGRLGRVMWNYSKGYTTAPLKSILEHEIEVALAALGYPVVPSRLNYIDVGLAHAFGKDPVVRGFWDRFGTAADEAMLCGDPSIPIEPLSFSSIRHRQKFAQHLTKLNQTKKTLHPKKWDDWLYAISMVDIIEPLNEVFSRHGIAASEVGSWGPEKLKQFMNAIPTRKLDIHLHRQVLKNDQYKVKQSDLEDWAGLGAAACYADVVVCEKHFATMLGRDKNQTHARIQVDLYELFKSVPH